MLNSGAARKGPGRVEGRGRGATQNFCFSQSGFVSFLPGLLCLYEVSVLDDIWVFVVVLYMS